MVIQLFSPLTSTNFPPHLIFYHPKSILFPPLKRRHRFVSSKISASSTSSNNNSNYPTVPSSINENRPRTLFPGGYKRPEIKVPNLVLRLSSEEVLRDNSNVLDIVDDAVSDRVGIVVLNGGVASGKKLYEAACLLKSVIRDRAYLLIDERVDIAAAVSASGVLLSDQGLPSIVARNTMMNSNTESVVLPLVARNVQTLDAALAASSSEGADFLIYSVAGDGHSEGLVNYVFKSVKIPIFITVNSLGDEILFEKALNLLRLGASGVVVSVDEFSLFRYDTLSKLFHGDYAPNRNAERSPSSNKPNILDAGNGFPGKKQKAGFTKLDEKDQQFIENEKAILLEAMGVIQRARPLMGEISLLRDAVSQLDQPFLLVIVGEFNSGKSSVINAFLGQRYLKDGVVPTTNEITFLRCSELDYNVQRYERHPDGQYVCYLPAPVLKEMIIVDTPGTNVILQRQQRLTEEFVPRADIILFVISADRPLTESEVSFLRYIQQWEKKVVFVLNKSDLYQNNEELNEAITFIKENAKKLLNTEHVMLFPVSARVALEAKLSGPSGGLEQHEKPPNASYQGANNFSNLETYLYSFLDGSSSNGIERMKLKLETPVKIAEQLLSASQKLINEECQQAREDLKLVNDLIISMKDYVWKLESESISWKRQILSLINNTQARVIKLVESTLQLSNIDLVTSHVFKADKSASMPVTSSLRNDTIDPAMAEAKKLLGEYETWLQSNSARQGSSYRESLEKKWPSLIVPSVQSQLEANELLKIKHEVGMKVIDDFSAAAASKLFEQEIREVFVTTFGGLGAAGLSASLLTSILPTTLEDLLALGLCSAGGLLAVSNFPARRQKVIDKVKRTADALARQLEESMQKEFSETAENLNKFAELVGQPYQDMAQSRVNKLSNTLDELMIIEEKIKTLQIEIQNLHVSR